MENKAAYQAHIDGLRAIAVLSVVLYDLGLRQFPGGFVGVDIFFVISGFLISRIIYAETARGEFSLRRFYLRRLRRIAPAFIAVSAACTLAAYFFLFPQERVDFAHSLIASVLLAPNVYFWWITRSYFEPAADMLPLLHYWSLGVEEQFYLVFPVIALAALKGGRRWLGATLLVLALVSLVASSLTVRHDPGTAFYLFPFRAYELLIGCLLALPGIPCPTRPKVAAGATALGLVLLAAAVALTPKIQNTLDKLIAGGIKPIMLGMFPQYRAAVPKILADRMRRGDHNQLSGRDLDPATMTRERALRAQFATRPGVKFVSALDAACPAQQCPLLVGDSPVEFDDHHLTEAGSVYFAQRLLPEILR